MKIAFQLIQVFDSPAKNYRGNISAVILFDKLPAENVMQRIAGDLGQPATTFLAPENNETDFFVRWFAPDGEIGLCGHGSMAAMAFLQQILPNKEYKLHYRQGTLKGRAFGDAMASIRLKEIPVINELAVDQALRDGLGIEILGYWHTDNKDIVLVNSEKDLRDMKPDFNRLRQRKTFGYAVTAKGTRTDFVSRTLVPHVDQLEDHATGSSHAILVPFWAQRLAQSQLEAEQLSPRKGLFSCAYDADKGQVELSGHYSVLATGEFQL